MAEAYTAAIQDTCTNTAIYLCAGSLALGTSENLRHAIGLWQNEGTYSVIVEEVPPPQKDVAATRSLLTRSGGNHTDLTDFLNRWLSETDAAFSDHPDQLTML